MGGREMEMFNQITTLINELILQFLHRFVTMAEGLETLSK